MRIYLNIALAAGLLLSVNIFAQQPLNQVNILSFSVKNKLPADVNGWDNIPGALVLVAQKVPQASMKGVKLSAQIKKGGAKICGTSPQSAVLTDSFTVRNFSAAEIVGNLSQCPKLQPGFYSLCVQFFNIDNYPISREMCKEFSVEDVTQAYSSPQNLSPANEKKFSAVQATAPITFRWTPLVPKPKEPVTYRLRVWQLMQGQNGTQAMRTNDPIAEKEVTNITQAIVTNILIGPCKPPYLCDFIWSVQALDKEGRPIGGNNGMSEGYLFKVLQSKQEE